MLALLRSKIVTVLGIPEGGVPRSAWVSAVSAMVVVVVSSNVLVQFPVAAHVGALDLADLLTWGTFSYPAAFLVTDLTNRRFGAAVARRVVVAGLLAAVVLSIAIATPRIAIASATAFLVGQLIDVQVFHRIRSATGERYVWLRATGSTAVSQLVDSFVVIWIAFVLGPQRWPTSLFLAVSTVNYLYKMLAAVALIPAIYLLRRWIHDYLGHARAEQLMREAAGERYVEPAPPGP